MPKVNPENLRWARETAGFTLEEATKKLGIKEAKGVSAVNRLAALESGETEPTRPLLSKMAKKYRRPLLVFYLSNPPRKGDRGQDFRTLPEGYSEESSALVDALIRDVQARQGILRAALEDEEEDKPLDFVGSMQMSDGILPVVNSIKSTIKFDLSEFHNQLSPTKAFKYLRSKVESVGVFVLLIGDLGSWHTAFDLDVYRGFALSDDIAPFIIINNKDAKSAWSFTLVHELAHIWLGQTGISGSNSEKRIEQFCNQVASELLLPEAELDSLNLRHVFEFKEKVMHISLFAQERNLSSSMVAYNLYLKGEINNETWYQLDTVYQRLWLDERDEKRRRAREKKSGPDYFKVRKYLVGENLITLVQRMMAGGTLTTSKAGKVLGVKPIYVQKLFDANIQPISGRAS